MLGQLTVNPWISDLVDPRMSDAVEPWTSHKTNSVCVLTAHPYKNKMIYVIGGHGFYSNKLFFILPMLYSQNLPMVLPMKFTHECFYS